MFWLHFSGGLDQQLMGVKWTSSPETCPHLFPGHDGRLDWSDWRDGQSGGGRGGSADDTVTMKSTVCGFHTDFRESVVDLGGPT